MAVVLGGRPGSALELGLIQAELEDAVGARVDLVVLDLDVPVEVAETVLEEAVLVYDGGWCRWELARLYSKYLDFRAWLERRWG